MAVGVSLQALAAIRETRTFALAHFDILEVFLELSIVHDRAHLRARLERVVDHKLLESLDHGGDEPIVEFLPSR
jgi:hypothetical protein